MKGERVGGERKREEGGRGVRGRERGQQSEKHVTKDRH